MHMQKPGELLVWFPMCNVSTMSSCKAAEATGNLISITPGGDLDRVVPSFSNNGTFSRHKDGRVSLMIFVSHCAIPFTT